MTHACHHATATTPRRGGIVVGLAAGGMLLVALGQLASAPGARADVDITDVIASIQATDSVGEASLSTAGTDFASGDVAAGLAAEFTGLDDILFNTQDDLLLNGYQALQGIDGPYGYYFFGYLPTPTDLAETSSYVTLAFDDAQSSLTYAASEFGSGAFVNGLAALNSTVENLVAASQLELIGLTDTLLAGL